MSQPVALQANATLPWLGGGDLATWIIAISILVSTILSVLAFLGIAQGMQMRVWRAQIESRLRIIEGYIGEVRDLVLERLRRAGVEDADKTVDTAMEYFMVEPVSIEPTDIIKRLERILRTGEERIESLVARMLRGRVSWQEERNIVTLLTILNALNTVYKVVRHMLLLGVKLKNPMLVMQAWMLLPLYMRIAKAYRDAAKVIMKGIPIGDAAGPLAAYRLISSLPKLEGPTEIAKDTVYALLDYEGRRVVVVKAKGPGSTVGRPGEAVEKLVEMLPDKSKIKAIITVDAALKLEGEKTGSVAEGSGVAMGDPGPEKIRIERIAARLGVPLYAVAIKMGMEEAITAMKREVADGVEEAVERVRGIIRDVAGEGDVVIVVGVGNTVGVAQ
ncbi:MAG: DUF1512 domain-containing protein [Crenarchaeota archaeon]|nr:DUF1512 domain-containing protein [Thermoproteota archaeon]